ncbi:Snowski, identical [Brugia malayi]|uniref:Bm8396 n=2 Tax=Brugia TaxID=6278 RepID=A0A0J9XMS5_BRUMA|nr:Snowski, identical [Brugia malayi]CDP91294.2 Bm8396 [Brugia malayi]VIO95007.1 Snowski, identical [Brugia malayi]
MSTVIVTSILSTTTTTATGAVTLTSTLMSTKNSIATTTTSATTTNTTNLNSMKQLITAATTTTDDILLDELSSRLHGVLPIQPTPLLLPSDHISSSLKSTRLNGHLIYCFVIGGECRLCFPQIISVVLHDVPISDINELFINLNIHISVASQQQLDTLKLAGIMPMTADSCGLITKSDAEHLVAKLLPQCSGYRLATAGSSTTTTAPTTTTIAAATTTAMIKSYDELMMNDAIPVMHDCFDGCTGILIPMLNCDEQIECTQCKLLFTGEKFVSHSHSMQQIQRICHWGFDSSNWRHYLHLPESYENDLKALQKLELYKYPTMMHRLGKRSASNAFTTIESGSCSKVANLAMTTAPSSSTAIKSIETETEIGGIGIEITPTITTSSMMKSSMNNDFNEYNILKFSTTTTTATTPITITNTYATTTIADTTTVTVVTPTIPSATLTTNSSSFLPIQIPVINDQSSSSSASSGISLINSQLQSLLALQLITSQLPLANESYRLPILTNLPSHLTSDIRWKSIYDIQSSLSSSLLSSSAPLINNNNNNSNNNNSNKLTVDMRQITDENLPNKYIPILSTTSSTTSNNTTISTTTTTNNTATATTTTRTNFDIPITSTTTTTSKTAISLEKLLDQTLKEPVLSVAKLLIMEFRREKELLLNQNGQLRRENALLRSALASSTVLVGLKGLTTTNVPIS